MPGGGGRSYRPKAVSRCRRGGAEQLLQSGHKCQLQKKPARNVCCAAQGSGPKGIDSNGKVAPERCCFASIWSKTSQKHGRSVMRFSPC